MLMVPCDKASLLSYLSSGVLMLLSFLYTYHLLLHSHSVSLWFYTMVRGDGHPLLGVRVVYKIVVVEVDLLLVMKSTSGLTVDTSWNYLLVMLVGWMCMVT